MESKEPKKKRGSKSVDHGLYWTRPTAKPRIRPMPSPGQLLSK